MNRTVNVLQNMFKSHESTINTTLYKWMVTFLTGLFMFVVLYIYKGYNIDQTPSLSGHSLLSRAIVHAVATSLVFYVGEFHVRKYLKPMPSTRYVFLIVGELLLGIHVTFLLFNYFWQWTELHWKSYSMFLYEYPMVVIFPIVLSQLLSRKTNVSSTYQNEYVVITSDNGKDCFRIKPEHLLFVRSADNYVEIYHSSKGEARKHLLRKSLKKIDEQHATNPYLVRCHRSYMVNPMNIDHIESNNRSLHLNVSGTRIPVSKKHLSDVSSMLSERSTPHLKNSSQTA